MIVLNIKRTSAMHRILQITKLCLIKVSWIVSFSDSVLIDDLYMARFVFLLAEGKECPEKSSSPIKQCNQGNSQMH